MAAYTDVAGVQALRPHHPITGTSRPSTSEVLAQIENLCQYVDGLLAGASFVIPITGPISTAYLRSAVSFGVAAIAEDQQRAGISGDGNPNNVTRSNYWALFEGMLQAILENPGILVDAPMDPNSPGVKGPVIESFFTRYPLDSQTEGMAGRLGPSSTPRFKVSQEF